MCQGLMTYSCNSDTKWTSVAECGRDLYAKLTSAYKERELSTRQGHSEGLALSREVGLS